ncbi:MAG TPA: response regulator [Kofleriaceae bacterium]|jgi:DNA-binding NtrC family response regulator|nr:response regulator [Kofleriaceae bacterium]
MANPQHSLSARIPGMARELVGAEVLVVDQDERVHQGMGQLLNAASLHVTCVRDPEAALAQIDRKFYSVVLVDLDTPTPSGGIDTVRAIKAASPTSMIIALTPRRSFEDAVTAVRAGAIDLILKAPDSVAYLKERVLDAAGRSVGKREVDSVLGEVRAVHEEFLQKFMDAERRALDAADKASGKDPARSIELDNFAVLLVDEVDSLADALNEAAPAGFTFIHATSGGEALDRVSSGKFHYAMVSDELHDLPASMVVSTVRTQSPDTVVFQFRGPGPDGYVNLIETLGQRPIVTPFDDPAQLIARLDELAEAFRARARERRYTQNFRERHYDFLRRYVELKTKIDRALNDGPG